MSLCLQQRLRVCFKSYDEFLWGCGFISFGLVRCHPSGWWDSRPYEHIRAFALNLVACITTIFKLAFLHQIPLGSTLLRGSHPCFAKLYTSAPTERCEWYMRRWIRYVRGGPDGEDGEGTGWPTVWWAEVSCGYQQSWESKVPPPQCHLCQEIRPNSRDDWPWYHAFLSLNKKALISFN